MIQRNFCSGIVSSPFEWRKTNSKLKIGTFRFCTTDNLWNKKTKSEGSVFITFTAFEKKAELLEKHAPKGKALEIEYVVKNNNWKDKDGKTHYDMTFLVTEVKFVRPDAKYLSTSYEQEQMDDPMLDDYRASKSDEEEFLNIPEGSDEELPFN